MNPILTTHIFSGWVGKKPATSWWIGGGKIGTSNLGDNNHHRNPSGPMLHERTPPFFGFHYITYANFWGGVFKVWGKDWEITNRQPLVFRQAFPA